MLFLTDQAIDGRQRFALPVREEASFRPRESVISVPTLVECEYGLDAPSVTRAPIQGAKRSFVQPLRYPIEKQIGPSPSRPFCSPAILPGDASEGIRFDQLGNFCIGAVCCGAHTRELAGGQESNRASRVEGDRGLLALNQTEAAALRGRFARFARSLSADEREGLADFAARREAILTGRRSYPL